MGCGFLRSRCRAKPVEPPNFDAFLDGLRGAEVEWVEVDLIERR